MQHEKLFCFDEILNFVLKHECSNEFKPRYDYAVQNNKTEL